MLPPVLLESICDLLKGALNGAPFLILLKGLQKVFP